MRIGDTVNAGLLQYNPSQLVQQSGISSQLLSQSIAGVGAAIDEKLKAEKEDKDIVKQAIAMGEAYKTLKPDSATAIDPLLFQLKSGENKLSDQASLGKTMGDLINMDISLSDKARAALQDQQDFDLRKREFDMREQAFNAEIFEAGKSREERDALASAAGPLLLGNVMDVAKSHGMNFDPAAFENLSPANKAKMSEVLASMIPESEKTEFRDIPITMGGQPGTATAAFNRKTGTFDIVPVREAGQAWGDGSGGQSVNPTNVVRVPFTNYSKGGKAGPDELTDPWTEKGYSSSGKNLTPGMVAVNEKAFKLGTVFRDPKTGEVFIAGDRHGNKNPRTVDFYQEPGSYKRESGQRDLEVVGFEPSVGKSPQEVQAQLQKYRGGGITPGAAKGGGETPLDIQIKEAQLAKTKQEIAGKEHETTEAKSKAADLKSAALSSAKEAIREIDEIPKHPGFSAAVGAGVRKSLSGLWGVPNDPIAGSDEAGSVAQIEKLRAHAFLTGIQQLRGMGALSDAEGKKIDAAVANLDRSQGEADFKKSLANFRKVIEETVARLGGTTADASQPAASAADYSSRLRAKLGQK